MKLPITCSECGYELIADLSTDAILTAFGYPAVVEVRPCDCCRFNRAELHALLVAARATAVSEDALESAVARIESMLEDEKQ